MERIQIDDIEDILYIQNGIKDLVSSYIQKYFDSDTDNELKSQVTSTVTKVYHTFLRVTLYITT